MALTDLLWACPECGEDRALRGPEPGVCRACGARFERAHGSTIRRTGRDGSEVLRTPAEWVDLLPDLDSALRPDPDGMVRLARVTHRAVAGEEVIRDKGAYLNRVERFGPETEGELELREDRLVFRTRDPDPAEIRWSLERLTAVQASSKSLQIKERNRPLASFRFVDDSIFLWEQLLNEALRRLYRRSGKGEIMEFQPRITTA